MEYQTVHCIELACRPDCSVLSWQDRSSPPFLDEHWLARALALATPSSEMSKALKAIIIKAFITAVLVASWGCLGTMESLLGRTGKQSCLLSHHSERKWAATPPYAPMAPPLKHLAASQSSSLVIFMAHSTLSL